MMIVYYQQILLSNYYYYHYLINRQYNTKLNSSVLAAADAVRADWQTQSGHRWNQTPAA